MNRPQPSLPRRHAIKPARVVLLAGLTVCVLMTGGCFKGVQMQTPNGVADGSARGWDPKPVGMRVYPSTRYVLEDNVPLLEACIELLDAMRDPIKSSGTVRCELFASSGTGRALGERLYSWDVKLQTLADQRAYYDPITRGYLFRLKLDNFDIASQDTALRVTFTPTDGPRLQAEAELGKAR